MADVVRRMFARGEIAIMLALQGFRVFPLRPGEKVPALINWPSRATSNVETIRVWWMQADYNIGIATGRGDGGFWIIVVDYDMKGTKEGGKWLLAHTERGLCDTMQVQTPHGVHCIYIADVHVPNSVSRVARHVDVRGHRGYVVAAGSTVDGVTYEWIPTSRSTPQPIPQELLELAVRPGESEGDVPSNVTTLPIDLQDSTYAIDTARAWLVNTAPEAVEGDGGDLATLKVAYDVRALGVSEGRCLELMLRWWNQEKALPPWEPEDLRRKVANAYRYAKRPMGRLNPHLEFAEDIARGAKAKAQAAAADPKGLGEDGASEQGEEPPEDEQGTGKAPGAQKRLTRRKAREAKARALVKVPALVKDVLGVGALAVAYGQSGKGKTFVMMDLAWAVAVGGEWNGHPVERSGLVVYVAAEGGEGINKRVAALLDRWEAAGGVGEPPFDVVPNPIDLLHVYTDRSDVKELVALVREAEREYGMPCVLLVIDTLSRALAGGDENSPVDMGNFIKRIDALREILGCTVGVVHHAGKDLARGARGWSGIQAAVDTEIEIADGEVTVTKQRDIDQIRPLTFGLRTVEVGPGITTCLVDWGRVREEMTDEQPTSGESHLLDAVKATADVLEMEPGEVQIKHLKLWAKAHDPEGWVLAQKDTTLRVFLKRCHDAGWLPKKKTKRRK